MKKLKKILIILFTIIGILAVAMTVAAGAMGGFGPFKFIMENRLAKLPGNGAEYDIANVMPRENSPLEGKNIYFLGSSVTKGQHSLDVSFADYLAKHNSTNIVKEAVSGTTLVDNGATSYLARMRSNIPTDAKIDLLVCQLSTNDATTNKPLGNMSSTMELEEFDTKTIIGAIEYILVYAKETWNCPVVFYTGSRYDSVQYEEMVAALIALQDKYEFGMIDLFHNEEMNQVSESDYALYMSDPIHPTQAGYLKWWLPVMEEYLYEYVETLDKQ